MKREDRRRFLSGEANSSYHKKRTAENERQGSACAFSWRNLRNSMLDRLANASTWGGKQRITVDEALRVNTINGAYATHEEAIKGSITAGKLADFVVLADDPHTADPNKIKDIPVVQTVTGGNAVYKA
jgi:predicted amidohydrolase YtcJ